ncbi:MAG: DedA family protein [Sphingosinicella sp.]|nr:DedA family protein [Sphingosinicella sp.]
MTEWITNLIEQSGYLGVAFLMFLETVFPPIPSEVIMTLAGLEAQRGSMTLPGVIAAGTCGAMLGNFFWYLLARALGIERFKPFIKRWGRWLTITWRDVEKSDRWFERHGIWFVLIGRMLPTVRSLVSVPAGLLHMRIKRFLIASTIGTAGWTAALALAGWELGTQYKDVDQYLGPLSIGILIALLAYYIFRVVHWNIEH